MLRFVSRDRRWLSNTWVLADHEGGHCVIVDAGAPDEPVHAWIAEQGLNPTHLLLTHHHYDHVCRRDAYRRRYRIPALGHPAEEELFGGLDSHLEHDAEVRSGDLAIRALHIPGHTLGQLAFAAGGDAVCTGDTLFRGSVGGTVGPGHTDFADLRRSILEVLMGLPHELEVLPGHMEPTTLAREWDENPFVRLWRGLDRPRAEACTALGRPARLQLEAPDYDGGTKCQVRFEDGTEAIVPGSRVERTAQA